ncbi:uncharacterized protein B0H18DRAFT_1102267 [Fomitopsis serialis]|uniref:uncharacterized protein n=1 Tax=Fomitopsis serialis TaxID=139415 RepID=UPI0020077E0C|nr:uncharacterized protein B0H18DRAFT_1102267 [Neoantrodia serialis]KAH9932458.1 hypothetical protein B0H18DRAFT_1102267 [Neoantrodia serialis]
MPTTIHPDREFIHLPDMIPTDNATAKTRTLPSSDAMSQQRVDETQSASYCVGVPYKHNVKARHQRSSSSGTSSDMSSWSSQAYTTTDSHAKAPVPLQDRNGNTLANHRRPEAPPTFLGGAFLNPVWVNTSRVGFGHVDRAHTHMLEPFRVPRGAILNPVWIDTPGVGRGNVSGARADLEPFRPSLAEEAGDRSPAGASPKVSCVRLWGASDDLDWAVALSTYDGLNIEETKHAVDFLSLWKRKSESLARRYEVQYRKATNVVERAGEVLLEEIRMEDAPSLLLASLEEDTSAEVVDNTWPDDFQTPSKLDSIMPGLAGLGEHFED